MTERTLELYLRDVQRLLMQILNGIRRLSPGAADAIPQLAQIVAFRNVLVHGYHAISDRRVWAMIEEDLGELQTAVDALTDRL